MNERTNKNDPIIRVGNSNDVNVRYDRVERFVS